MNYTLLIIISIFLIILLIFFKYINLFLYIFIFFMTFFIFVIYYYNLLNRDNVDELARDVLFRKDSRESTLENKLKFLYRCIPFMNKKYNNKFSDLYNNDRITRLSKKALEGDKKSLDFIDSDGKECSNLAYLHLQNKNMIY